MKQRNAALISVHTKLRKRQKLFTGRLEPVFCMRFQNGEQYRQIIKHMTLHIDIDNIRFKLFARDGALQLLVLFTIIENFARSIDISTIYVS